MTSQSRNRMPKRSGLQSIAQVPSWVYQRYRQIWQRAGLSVGWALLYIWTDARIASSVVDGTPVPIEWRMVLAVLIVIGGLWRPEIAYAGFVVALAYPLYLISIYVMAVALAVLVLGAPVAARHLFLALMILCAPVLAPYHLTPVLPLLFGLWASDSSTAQWGRIGGSIAGGLCVLWLKIAAGMSGSVPDLWVINGWRMDAGMVYARFHTADSLETLLRLVEPLTASGAGSARVLLSHLLQVLAWVGAVYVVSAVRDLLLLRKQGRAGQGSAWTSVLSLVPGLVMIWAGYVAVPSWLQVAGPRWLDPLWLPAQVVLAGVVALGVDGLVRYLQQPVMARVRAVPISVPRAESKRGKRLARRRRVGTPQPSEHELRHVMPEKQSRQGGRNARVTGLESTSASQTDENARDGQGKDIIMIELD